MLVSALREVSTSIEAFASIVCALPYLHGTMPAMLLVPLSVEDARAINAATDRNVIAAKRWEVALERFDSATDPVGRVEAWEELKAAFDDVEASMNALILAFNVALASVAGLGPEFAPAAAAIQAIGATSAQAFDVTRKKYADAAMVFRGSSAHKGSA